MKVEQSKTGKGRGGRPAKIESERSTIKLNCWVTPIENGQLQARYTQGRAGKKLAFAQFLKQILFSEKPTKGPKPDELLLTIIINLQERGHQLKRIADLIEERKKEDRSEISSKIDQELVRIQKTIEQITTWLYES